MMQSHHETKHWIKELTGSKPIYVEVVAIDPVFQGKGLGSLLINHILSECPAGVPIYLESTKESNTSLYKRFGFRAVKRTVLQATKATDGESEMVLDVMVKDGF